MDEQFCSICGHEETEETNDAHSTVIIICDNCLKSDLLIPALEKFFLN
ncbi:hypothetical protein [Neobacillus sp. LXY-1]